MYERSTTLNKTEAMEKLPSNGKFKWLLHFSSVLLHFQWSTDILFMHFVFLFPIFLQLGFHNLYQNNLICVSEHSQNFYVFLILEMSPTSCWLLGSVNFLAYFSPFHNMCAMMNYKKSLGWSEWSLLRNHERKKKNLFSSANLATETQTPFTSNIYRICGASIPKHLRLSFLHSKPSHIFHFSYEYEEWM